MAEVLRDDQVPAFRNWWIVQILLNSNEVAIFLNLRDLTLTDIQPSSEAASQVWLVTSVFHNEIVFRIMFLPCSHWMNRIHFRKVLLHTRALMGHNRSLSLSPPTKSSKEEMEDSSNLSSWIKGIWVLATSQEQKKRCRTSILMNAKRDRKGHAAH